MDEIKFKGKLRQHSVIHTLIQKCICRIKEIPEYQTLKLEPQLIRDIMNVINEEMSNERKIEKIVDKKELVKEVYKQVYKDEINEDLENYLDKTIDFLLDSKIVKKKKLIIIKALKYIVKKVLK